MPQQAQCALWLCQGKPERYTLKVHAPEGLLVDDFGSTKDQQQTTD